MSDGIDRPLLNLLPLITVVHPKVEQTEEYFSAAHRHGDFLVNIVIEEFYQEVVRGILDKSTQMVLVEAVEDVACLLCFFLQEVFLKFYLVC